MSVTSPTAVDVPPDEMMVCWCCDIALGGSARRLGNSRTGHAPGSLSGCGAGSDAHAGS